MKKLIYILLAVICGMLFSESLKAQREIQFAYDVAGNMTSRTILMPQNTTEDNSDLDVADVLEEYTDEIDEHVINLYPNPTKGKLVVEISNYQTNTKDKIVVYNMHGQLLKQISTLSNSNLIDLSSNSSGTYILKIFLGDKSTEWKIIKQ